MKEIDIGKSYKAKVDDWNFDRINQNRWYALEYQGRVCAIRTVKDPETKKTKTIYMHREIMGVADENILVDHRDWDALNNQEYNLRRATDGQNKMNSRNAKSSKSRFKGVVKLKKYEKWRARIMFNGISHHLGYFDTEIDGAIAYNEAAKIYFKEFAFLNPI